MIIRDATAADDHAVGELLVDAFVQTYAKKLPDFPVTERRRADLRNVAAKRQVARVWVAESDAGEVVGTVQLYPPGAPGTEAWLPNAADLRQLAVRPDFHGKGVGKLLMDHAEAEAWRTGVEAVCLHVRRGVEGVARLYMGRGYRRAPEGDLQLPDVYLEAYVLERPR